MRAHTPLAVQEADCSLCQASGFRGLPSVAGHGSTTLQVSHCQLNHSITNLRSPGRASGGGLFKWRPQLDLEPLIDRRGIQSASHASAGTGLGV